MPENTRSRHLALGITGVVLVAVVAFLWRDLASDPELTRARGRDPGPAFQPVAMLALLGACAFGLAVASFVRYAASRRATASEGGSGAGLGASAMPALMVATLLVFVAAVPVTGFLPAAFVFTVGWSALIAWRDRETPRGLAIAAGGGAALAYGIFTVFSTWIGVPL